MTTYKIWGNLETIRVYSEFILPSMLCFYWLPSVTLSLISELIDFSAQTRFHCSVQGKLRWSDLESDLRSQVSMTPLSPLSPLAPCLFPYLWCFSLPGEHNTLPPLILTRPAGSSLAERWGEWPSYWSTCHSRYSIDIVFSPDLINHQPSSRHHDQPSQIGKGEGLVVQQLLGISLDSLPNKFLQTL